MGKSDIGYFAGLMAWLKHGFFIVIYLACTSDANEGTYIQLHINLNTLFFLNLPIHFEDFGLYTTNSARIVILSATVSVKAIVYKSMVRM